MANTIKLGAGKWATGTDTVLAFNDENNNFKPLPFSFSRASSATVVNQSGLIETVGSGEPRIDFQGNTKGALLLEPQRTNLIPYSNDFSSVNNAEFATPNYGTSPEGLSVSRVLFTSANQSMSANTSLSTGVVCNFSAYVKGVQGEFIKFAAGGQDISHFFSGQWERLSGSATSINNSWNLNTYGYATARDFLICGAQLEVGSYSTSIIPTSGSAVTRVGDACTNGANSEVINSTEGVLYAEISALANDGTYRGLCLSNGSASNRVLIYLNNGSNQLRANVVAQGNLQANLIYTVSDVTILNKVAIRWSLNNVSFWINGSKVLQDLDAPLMPTGLNELSFDSNGVGGEKFYGNTKDVRVYNTALTDAELASLTTI